MYRVALVVLAMPFVFANDSSPKTSRLAFLQEDDEAPNPKAKQKPVKNSKDWFKVSGIGTIKGEEVIIKNVAYKIAFANKTPGEGRVISFTGTFDGTIVQCQGWSRPLEGRAPFLDFQAEGTIKLLSPGKDQFLVHTLKIDLPFLPDDIQDAVEKGARIRVLGGLSSRADGFNYIVTRIEVAGK